MKVSAAQPGSMLIGREAELAGVAGFLGGSSSAARALVVEGEAGIGKTTVVRAALEDARRIGLDVLVARPSAGETELPYAALADLLAARDGHDLAVLARAQREAVEAALGRASGVADEHALSRGLLELLRAWSAEGELLLAVDDVQWLDRPTASVLTFALRRLASAPLRVLLAVRSNEASEPPLGVHEWEDVRRLVVGPMSATELGALVRSRLGVQLSRPQVETLGRSSGGNPLFAVELARRGADEPVEGATLAGVVTERLREIRPDARTALTYAAAALRPTVDLLVTAGIDRSELRAALDSSALEIEGDRLSFTHPLFRSAAYELLLPDERREIHARLAAASTDIVERGHHVSCSVASPDEDAAATLERAAAEAAALGDHAGAGAFLLRAAELFPAAELDKARARELDAVLELYLAGDLQTAIRVCRGLVDRLPVGVLRARARLALVTASIGSSMSYHDAFDELAATLGDAADDPALQAELHVELSETACGLCRLEDAVAHARRAFELADGIGAARVSVAALAIRGFAESMLGKGVPAAARQAFARWDGRIGLSNSPRMELACACMHATEFAEAALLFEQELAAAQELGLEPIEVVARSHLAEVQLRAGDWSNGVRNARLALEHARQAADPQIVAATSCVVATAEALLGDHEHARSLAAVALVDAEALHDFWWTIYGRAVLGFVALTEGESQTVVDALSPAWRMMIDQGLGDLSIFPVGHVLGESLVLVGRVQDANEVVDRLRACPAGRRPWCTAMASRIAALVASAKEEHDAARAAINAALDAHQELPEPFEHARTVHLQGRIEHHARNWGAARSALVEALERFDELGAPRWAEKVAADLARIPGRRPIDKVALTTREREIAELAAAALTNKDIAARLFLSVRTVEANLSKVYAKLGVRSRTELASRVGVRDA